MSGEFTPEEIAQIVGFLIGAFVIGYIGGLLEYTVRRIVDAV